MKQSERLGLWLPEGSDPLEVSKLSENFEKLDPLGGGLEAIKEGTGPGSLFMVSKCYKEPIENALLCNGGTVSAEAYPELYDVLGTTHGGTLTSDLLNSEYGITSTLGYPQAYNADLDMFVYCEAGALTLYQKGQAPKNVPFSSSMATDNFLLSSLSSFGYYVLVGYKSSGTNTVWKYDLTAESWETVSASDPLFGFAIGLYGTGSSSMSVDLGDFIFAGFYSGDKLAIDKSTASAHTINYAGVGHLGACINLDDPDNVYVLHSFHSNTSSSDSKCELYRFPKSSLATDSNQAIQLELVKTLPTGYTNQYGNPNDFYVDSVCVISNGFCYARQGGILCCYDMASSAARWMLLGPTNVTGYLVLAKKITDATTILGYTGKSLYYTVTGATASTTSISSIVANPVSFQATYGPVCTASGARGNWRVSAFKLPTITMPEALIYMRTQ